MRLHNVGVITAQPCFHTFYAIPTSTVVSAGNLLTASLCTFFGSESDDRAREGNCIFNLINSKYTHIYKTAIMSSEYTSQYISISYVLVNLTTHVIQRHKKSLACTICMSVITHKPTALPLMLSLCPLENRGDDIKMISPVNNVHEPACDIKR